MTIERDVKFDASGHAQLGQDPGDHCALSQLIELRRAIITSIANPPKPARAEYHLTICQGDNDISFHGMSKDELVRLATELLRLAMEPWSVP